MVRFIILRRNALPHVMTEQQKFRYPITDCSLCNKQESFREYKVKDSHIFCNLSKSKLASRRRLHRKMPTNVIVVLDGNVFLLQWESQYLSTSTKMHSIPAFCFINEYKIIQNVNLSCTTEFIFCKAIHSSATPG